MEEGTALVESPAAQPHTEGGTPCFHFPQAILPKTPDICTSLFVHQALLTQPKVSRGPDGDMAGSHLVFSQDPQTLPPSDSACLIPTTPFSSAPESLSTFTVCQLGSLNTLHTESQPASQPSMAIPGPLPMPLFLLGWGVGKREKASLQRLSSSKRPSVVSFQSTLSSRP